MLLKLPNPTKYAIDNIIIWRKDIISIDEKSANEQRAKTNGANYLPYWIK